MKVDDMTISLGFRGAISFYRGEIFFVKMHDSSLKLHTSGRPARVCVCVRLRLIPHLQTAFRQKGRVCWLLNMMHDKQGGPEDFWGPPNKILFLTL